MNSVGTVFDENEVVETRGIISAPIYSTGMSVKVGLCVTAQFACICFCALVAGQLIIYDFA